MRLGCCCRLRLSLLVHVVSPRRPVIITLQCVVNSKPTLADNLFRWFATRLRKSSFFAAQSPVWLTWKSGYIGRECTPPDKLSSKLGNPPCLKIVKSLPYVAASLKMCLSCEKKRRFLYLLDQHTAPLARSSSSFLLPKNFPISSTMTDRWVGIW